MRSMAPPENMLNSPRKVPWFWLNSACSCSGSIPGTGMCVPIRYTITASRTNSSLAFSSASPSALPGFIVFAISGASFRSLCDLATGGFNRRAGTLRHAYAFDGPGLVDLTGKHDLGARDAAVDDVGLLERSQVDDITCNLRQLRGTNL